MVADPPKDHRFIDPDGKRPPTGCRLRRPRHQGTGADKGPARRGCAWPLRPVTTPAQGEERSTRSVKVPRFTRSVPQHGSVERDRGHERAGKHPVRRETRSDETREATCTACARALTSSFPPVAVWAGLGSPPAAAVHAVRSPRSTVVGSPLRRPCGDTAWWPRASARSRSWLCAARHSLRGLPRPPLPPLCVAASAHDDHARDHAACEEP